MNFKTSEQGVQKTTMFEVVARICVNKSSAFLLSEQMPTIMFSY